MRLYRLSEAPLWGDEIFSWIVAHTSPGRIIGYLAQGNNPPLWELILHFWRRVGGDTEFILRLPAAFFSAVAAAALYALGTSIGGRWAGTVAAFCWTFSTYGQSIGREARAYALLAALTALGYLALIHWVRTGKGKYLWVLTALLNFYTHYMGLWSVALQVGALWYLYPAYRREVPTVLFVLTVGAGVQGVVFVDRLFNPAELGYAEKASLEGLYNMLWHFSNMPVPTVFAIGMIFGGVIYRLWQERGFSPEEKLIHASFWGVLLPMWGVGYILHLWNPRYLMPAAMGYYIVLGVSVASLPRWLRWSVSVPFMVLWAATWEPAPLGPMPFQREVMRALEQRSAREPLIVSPAYQAPMLFYYPMGKPCRAAAMGAFDPLASFMRCVSYTARVWAADAYAELPACELAAADTLWWLDFQLRYDQPRTMMEKLLLEDFTLVNEWRLGKAVILWKLARRRPDDDSVVVISLE